MKNNRKKIIIASFILLDFIFGGIVIGKNNINTSTTSIVKKSTASANEIVEGVNVISDGFSSAIGTTALSQDDIAVAQSILLNNQASSMKKADVVSSVVNTVKTTGNNSKKTLSSVEENERRVKEQEEIIKSKVTTKNGKAVASFALNFVGNPYVMGGNSLTHGTDCSGFTKLIYARFGIDLPRVARDQASVGKEVSLNAIQPGDLVFYSSGQDYVTHVAIYIGNGQIVHARTPYNGIGVNSIFIMRRLHIRRVID